MAETGLERPSPCARDVWSGVSDVHSSATSIVTGGITGLSWGTWGGVSRDSSLHSLRHTPPT